jgi:hypothetical protein
VSGPVRIDILAACGLADRDPEWRARWMVASFLEREAMHEAERRRGVVTSREPDFSLSVAPEYFWPPGHYCNGGGAAASQGSALGALNAPAGDLWRNPLGMGNLDPRRLLARAQEALNRLSEWVRRQVQSLADTLNRYLGLGKWAILAALAIFLGLGWLVFDRVFPAAPTGRAR